MKKKHDAKYNFKIKILHSFINAKKLTLEKKTSYYNFNKYRTHHYELNKFIRIDKIIHQIH